MYKQKIMKRHICSRYIEIELCSKSIWNIILYFFCFVSGYLQKNWKSDVLLQAPLDCRKSKANSFLFFLLFQKFSQIFAQMRNKKGMKRGRRRKKKLYASHEYSINKVQTTDGELCWDIPVHCVLRSVDKKKKLQ